MKVFISNMHNDIISCSLTRTRLKVPIFQKCQVTSLWKNILHGNYKNKATNIGVTFIFNLNQLLAAASGQV